MKKCRFCKRNKLEKDMSMVMYRFRTICLECSIERTARKAKVKQDNRKAFAERFKRAMKW